jgi:hypothetical protein
MELEQVDRLLDIEQLRNSIGDKKKLSRSSVFRNPELRRLRIKIGARTFWSQADILQWIRNLRKQVNGD